MLMANKLRNIKLFEEFTESKNHIIRNYFVELSKSIKTWFDSGSLSTQGLELTNLDSDNMGGGITKTLKFDFKDNEHDYAIIAVVDHTMFNENEISNVYLTVKRYDSGGNLTDCIEEPNLDAADLTEDYIIAKIASMDNEK